MKNRFLGRIYSNLFVLFFSMTFALSISISSAIGAVYDDFNGSMINSTLWNIDNPGGIFSQSGGLLNADGPPNLTYAHLRSRYSFRADVEFVLDYRDFQATATIFTQNCPQIWIQIEDESENFLYIFRGLCGGGNTFTSNGRINGWWLGGSSAPASSQSGLLKISRIGSTITTSYDEGAGWVTLGTFSGVFTGDVIVQIAVYTGDNGTFHVSSDWITYEGQMVSPPDVAGCIELQGSPLAGRKVIIRQPLEPDQITKTDTSGCYKFDNAVSGKRFKVIIKGPIVP